MSLFAETKAESWLYEYKNPKWVLNKVKTGFRYERKMGRFFFLLLVFSQLKSKQALSKAKKINKTNKKYSILRSL